MISNKGGFGLGIALFVLGLLVGGLEGVALVTTGLVFMFVLLAVKGWK